MINGPASANYDHDIGSLMLMDWTHEIADYWFHQSQIDGVVTQNNGLINGTNTFSGAGSSFSTKFVEGESYLLRVVNGALDTHYDFTIDNHVMQVIATDFVP